MLMLFNILNINININICRKSAKKNYIIILDIIIPDIIYYIDII